MIQRHDADISEQFEARSQVRKLLKVVKTIKLQDLAKAEKEKLEQEKRAIATGAEKHL